MGAFECVNASKISPTESTEVFTISLASNTTLNETRLADVEAQTKCHDSSKTKRGLWWKMGIDIPLLLLLITLIGLFELGVIPNKKAGFHCNDPALSFPYKGETVNTALLMSSLILLPIIFIGATEYIFLDSDLLFQPRARQACMNTVYLYRTYMYGLIFNLSIVEVMKGIVGSPRPTFFCLCEPNTAKTCTGSEFVATFECKSVKYSSWYQIDSYRSFPSGHASMSVYCGFFIAWYLQRRAFDWHHNSIVLVPLLQMLCVSYAAVCSLTRITDHRHHWWDVLFGTFIGLGTLFYAIILSNNFSDDYSKCCNPKSKYESEQTVRSLLFDEGRSVSVP